MGRKCAVVGCQTGYNSKQKQPPIFPFPKDVHESEKWCRFLNRPGYVVSNNSAICAFHFESKYLNKNNSRNTLKRQLLPVPTIYPSSTKPSLMNTPPRSRKPPKKRVYQADQMSEYKQKIRITQFEDVISFMKNSSVYKKIQTTH